MITSSGLTALLDPTAPGAGYKLPTFENVDLATASHEHSDHNAVGYAAGNPLVLKGINRGRLGQNRPDRAGRARAHGERVP